MEDVITDPVRVFNGDESGFQICPSTGKVFAEKGSKNVYTVDKGDSKENITVMFTFSANGDTCVPMVIYPYQRIPEKISKSINPEWGVGRSDNGWMTSDTFYEYIANVFYPYLIKKKVKFPVILFLDGHKSHLSYSLSLLCNELQIEVFALYPNATRILQPCDVTVFRPLKEGWRRVVREWEDEHPGELLNKVTFAPLLEKAIQSSVKPETLVNGFKACGLCPLNPNNIDFSKCLGKATEHVTSEMSVKSDKTMNFKTFVSIVGQNKIQQFESNPEYVPVSLDDSYLFQIWKHYNEKSKSKDHSNINIVQNIFLAPTQSVANVSESPELRTGVNNRLSVDALLHSPAKLSRDTTVSASNLLTVETSVYSPSKLPAGADAINNRITVHALVHSTSGLQRSGDVSTNGCITDEALLQSSPKLPTDDIDDINTILSADILLNSAPKSLNTFTSQEDMLPFQNITDKQLIDAQTKSPQPLTKIDDTTEISNAVVVQSKSFGIFLASPETPKRKGKRNVERYPFAITSKRYQEMFEIKRVLKEKQEKEKEERKRKREVKLNDKKNTIKQNKQKNKKQKGKENKILCHMCHSDGTNDNAKTLQCDECKHYFHKNCIPKRHHHNIYDDEEETFLCHQCYKEDNGSDSDISETVKDASDSEVDELFNLYKNHMKQK